MATINKVFKPRRGNPAVMIRGLKKDVILEPGEFFIEYPDSGQGTGHCLMKMGNGIDTYPDLPYAMGDTSNDIITFGIDTSTSITEVLSHIVDNTKLCDLISALRQSVRLLQGNIDFLSNKIGFTVLWTGSYYLNNTSDTITGGQTIPDIRDYDYILINAKGDYNISALLNINDINYGHAETEIIGTKNGNVIRVSFGFVDETHFSMGKSTGSLSITKITGIKLNRG